MRRRIIRTAALFMACMGCLVTASAALGQTHVEEVRGALATLHDWIGNDENALKWRTFLLSDELEDQLALGEKADRAVVKQIYEAYASDTPGLQKSRFTAVRDALKHWLAELSLPRRDELPAAVRAAKPEFVPIGEAEAAAAKKSLVEATRQLERFLAKGNSANLKQWKDYLQWSVLEQQIKADAAADPRALESVAGAIFGQEPGLELPQFSAVRRALRKYIDTLALVADPAIRETYEKNLDELAERIEAIAAEGATEQSYAAGRILGWLESAGQVPHLVGATRTFHSRPNLLAHVSRELVAAGMIDEVDEPTEVRDVILGTSIRGQGHTKGTVDVALVPNAGRAHIEIRMVGTTNTTNVGYNGPVTLYTTSVAQLASQKSLFIDSKGLSTDPAVAQCSVQTQINNISGSGLATRIAWDRAAGSKRQAESIASRRAEERLERRVDEKTGKLAGDANAKFVDKFRNPLLRREQFPDSMRFSTTIDQLMLTWLQAGSNQLAAAVDPPPLKNQDDLSLRLHESMVSNFSEAAIGGVMMTDVKIEQLMKDLTGDVPEELRISPDKDPWSMTFDDQQPVSAAFAGEKLTLAIRGKQFTRGDTPINHTMKIWATYTLEKTSKGAKMVRQGDVQVEYVKGGRESLTQVAFKTFLRRKFDSLFKPEFVGEGMVLPGRWERAGKLTLAQLAADNGWLTLAWRMPNRDVRTATKSEP
jgi:hypothetical protein